MGPKKKKLTKAEKAARKEKKRQEKLEKARQLQRDQLTRQMAISSVNRKAIEKKYKEIIFNTQMPVVKQDVETMWHRFDFALELKNYVISCLLDEIDFDELQQHNNEQAHAEAIDDILGLGKKRLEEVHAWYEGERDYLLERRQRYWDAVCASQQLDVDDMRAMMYRMKNTQAEHDDAYKHETEVCKDEQKNEYGDMMNLMRTVRERKLDKVWGQCHKTLSDYRSGTQERRKLYDRLKARDTKLAAVLDRQAKTITDLYDEVRELQMKLQDARRYQLERRDLLVKEREFYATHYLDYKHGARWGAQRDKDQIVHLVVSSVNTIKRLEQILHKAELILKLATVCRKLETQDEKIMPFPTEETETEEAMEVIKTAIVIKQLQETETVITTMEKFWKRVGKVQMRCSELYVARNSLLEENSKLKLLLQSYIQDVAGKYGSL